MSLKPGLNRADITLSNKNTWRERRKPTLKVALNYKLLHGCVPVTNQLLFSKVPRQSWRQPPLTQLLLLQR